MMTKPPSLFPRDLWKRLRDQHRRRLLLPLSAGTLMLAAASGVAVQISRRLDAGRGFWICVAIMAGGFSLACLVGLILHRWRRESLDQTAHRMDERADAAARLEAAVQLERNPNPLREAQQADAQRHYLSYRKTAWSLALALMVILACAIIVGDVVILHRYRQRTPPPPPVSTNTVPDYGELLLTAPEAEIRAKALDDIAWEGTGRSSRPFDELSLEVAVNGIPKTTRALKAPTADRKNGTIAVSGSLLMDELGVVPFDVVSYHLHGVFRSKGSTSREVFSTPQFIEVRPLREDARLMPGAAAEGDPGLQKMADVTRQMLKFQILLNKAVFEARSCGLGWENEAFRAEVQSLATQQEGLQAELDKFLTMTAPEKFTPNMLEHLRKASDEMRSAIAGLSPPATAQEPPR